MPKTKEEKRLLASGKDMIRRLNNFETFLQSIPNTITDQDVLQKLRLRCDGIKGLHEKYNDTMIDLSVLSVVDEDMLDSDYFYDKYIDLNSRASLLLTSNIPKSSASTASENSHCNLNCSNSAQAFTMNTKLPRISLPPFYGNYTEFTSFYETFNSFVHDNPSLSDVEKFMHLKSSLRGAAAQTIANIQPSADNYKLAFDMVIDRYNNPKQIILNHIKGIFDLKIMNKRSSTDLRKLSDDFLKHVRALQNLLVPVEQCTSFLYHLLMSKLDIHTKTKFTEFKPRSIPSLVEIIEFLKGHCELLEEIDCNSKSNSYEANKVSENKNNYKPKSNNHQQAFLVTPTKTSCPNCKCEHYITQCPTFLSLSVKQKSDRVNELKLCRNCLRHSGNTCNSRFHCRICNKRHHSLLHFDNLKDNTEVPDSSTVGATQSVISKETPKLVTQNDTQISLSCFDTSPKEILLSTAVVKIRAKDHKWYTCRALLDSGSHVNFITQNLANKLQLVQSESKTKILGLNSCSTESNSMVHIQLSSLHNGFQTNLQCLTVPKISENLPLNSFEKSRLELPENVRLADNNFNRSLPVDLLIGAGKFYKLMCIGQISLGEDKPVLQKTLLGWVVSGPCSFNKNSKNGICLNLTTGNNSHDDALQNSLQAFWQIENVAVKNELSMLSREERYCEEYFTRTVSRKSDGRLVVSIPFNSNILKLGDSKLQATLRFSQLEKKLTRNPNLRAEYVKFIHEYIDLGHMVKVTNSEKPLTASNEPTTEVLDSSVSLHNIPAFYLPHHAVIKPSSLTTKIRVVFDGSAKSDSNVSINDTQIVGPVIQDDLVSILLRFRQHKIALTGDIEKMYRQILINPLHRKFQRILWRDSPELQLDTYELQTVTYGTASASYLATKSLQYLAQLNHQNFPKTSSILRSDFYMDDLITSADTVEQVLQIKKELIMLLAEAGLPIRKFLSNNPNILSDRDSTSFHTIPLGERENAKALGITWNSHADTIGYTTPINCNVQQVSKRTILSTVAQLFDPLGLVSPIVVTGKLIIQRLWQLQLAWDEGIPEFLSSEWDLFKAELPLLTTLKIPRHVLSKNASTIELHGFCDSSSRAFGCCIYVRCINPDKTTSTQLLCSKSRVAPIRTTTIPRLELCGALLLTQLLQKVKDSLTLNFSKVYLWTDSTIVLNWINSPPNKYKVFVANRIAAIQESSEPKDWHYVPTKQNPADIISRGSSSVDLISNELWWHGPSFLNFTPDQWPALPSAKAEEPPSEVKTQPDVFLNFLTVPSLNLFDKFSSLSKLKRVVAWSLRFIKNSQLPISQRRTGNLETSELKRAEDVLVTICQEETFSAEIKQLKNKQALKSDSSILPLSPFLDESGILRVGGRIRNSPYPFHKKFPALLPKEHAFTKLLFKHLHEKALHCGAQHLLATIREHYWPISGRNNAKKTVHDCIKCFRVNPRSYHPIMGDLPAKRLQYGTPAFSHVGVDYAGPILIKDRKLRGSKLIKSYISLFVCLVTRAVHLELTTSLSTESFIAVFRRFISRRGKPITMSSDNATNFKGAANELKELQSFLNSESTKNSFSDFMANEEIKWEFIIPATPHQGGMWERGVKSVKAHLKRVLGNTLLNYEDFHTLLTQIEAILNSRPLSPLSSDPSDLSPLTPAHFLISKPLYPLPEVNLDQVSENKLTLYQGMQRLVQSFWRRWSLEVVPELQQKTKWFQQLPNLITHGALVLIKEDNLPTLQWALGRVTEVHVNSDGVVRSVTLRISNGHRIKRSVHKLCVLPNQ